MIISWFSAQIWHGSSIILTENPLVQPNISDDFRSHLGQAAVSAAKVRSLNLNNYYFAFLMLKATFSYKIISGFLFFKQL